MALFDKLKEKVNKVVDVDKLSEKINKTADSLKQEISKAVDPAVREQERAEKEKALQEQREQQRQEKEKAIEAFWESINLEEELDYIFSVLEKSGATKSNFEKGLEHFYSKIETPLAKEEVLPVMRKALFARAFGDEHAIAKTVAIDYFIHDVVQGDFLTQYMRFAIAKEKYPTPEMIEPFVKALYGFAGHAFNYQHNRSAQGDYQLMTQEAFALIIEHSDVLKSYTDEDPFAADTVRNKWANDLYNAPLQMVRSSKLGGMLDKEEYVDAMCYFAYTALCENQTDGVEKVSVAEIAVTYSDCLKAIYDRIKH